MRVFKGVLGWLLVIVLVLGTGVFVFTNYSWVFSKRVKGRILDVQRVTDPSAILSPRASDAQIHSYSVLIQGEDGRLYTSSSEDRQWQVARKGYCVEALLYRYPPWELQRGNTFFNARLEQLKLCDGETAPPNEPPVGNDSAKPQPEGR